jgi:stage III sporulation protein SpoIIIAA|tara:strand:+ start:995 stop:2674 length:1680 start_codon:yes stop_codon:yes gene_type:complete
MLLADDLNELINILPQFISTPLRKHEKKDQLIEIVLDVGRRPEARFTKGETDYLAYRTIVWQDLDYILKKLGKFSGDNRAGIEKTLHRISSLRNRQGTVIGLTCRIGRAIFGTVSIIRDLLEQRKSILLLGKPGVGKTTAIREIARVLSDGMKKRVIIIDTSNEIAGDGDLPHPSIGKARRMQVPSPQNQHQIMVEAVENHMPEIIIIDEIGTELEATAARTIAERGVQLVGTAHGNALENLIKNPTISDLIGGIQYVTIGDEEAKRRGSSKSILERKAPPTFEIAVEIHDPQTWVIHNNVEKSVDLLLQGQKPPIQKRKFTKQNNLVFSETLLIKDESIQIDPLTESKKYYPEKLSKRNLILNKIDSSNPQKVKRSNKNKNFSLKKGIKDEFIFIFIYGINNRDLKSIIKTLNLPIIITKEIQYADAILALGNLTKNNKKLKQISHSRKLSIHTVQSNSILQISKALKQILKKNSTIVSKEKSKVKKVDTIINKKLLTPLEEARLIIEEVVIPKKQTIDLLPRPKTIRKLQHELLRHYNLKGLSVGKEPNLRLRIYPN